MIFDARPAAQGPNKMNNSNYESNKIVLNIERFRGLGEGRSHGGKIIFKIGASAPNENML